MHLKSENTILSSQGLESNSPTLFNPTRHIPDAVMRLDSGTAGQRNRQFFAMTDPNQFLICEKVLRTLEEDAFTTRD